MVSAILELQIRTLNKHLEIPNKAKMSTKKYSAYTNGKRQTLLETKNAYENSIDKEIAAIYQKSSFRSKPGGSSNIPSGFND